MKARELVEIVMADPYTVVEKLVPAWAMPRKAVEEMAGWLREAARAARRRRSSEILVVAMDAVFSSAPLREEIVEEFDRAAREKTPHRRDLSFLREILPEVAARYTKLRKVGSRLVGLCPLHRERHPSFFVYPNGTFFCFGCGKHGDAANLVSEAEGIPLKEAIHRLLEVS